MRPPLGRPHGASRAVQGCSLAQLAVLFALELALAVDLALLVALVALPVAFLALAIGFFALALAIAFLAITFLGSAMRPTATLGAAAAHATL